MQRVTLIELIRFWGHFPGGDAVKVLEGIVSLFLLRVTPSPGIFYSSFPLAYGRWVVFSLKIDVAIGSISRTYNLSGST